MTARILIVCTGNICRSPLGEQLLRENLRNANIDAVVTSAGTHAMTGSAMTPEAAALSTQYGASNTEHVARQLTEKLIADADLVLAATRDHRRDVVTLLPKATRYTFTLNQFARLVAPAKAEDFAADTSRADAQTGLDFPAFVASVASTRGLHPSPNPPTLDDVEDPYRQPAAVYDRAAAAINASVTTITAALIAAGA
ncbi:low molecular weight phosphatase family protein [Cryobacterium sp. M91]|uniref:arsenate reductase/protein-tyrosine-phosphatase family protein n=1 Tax=Cryobacterium sp. M91 TaxID=2048294 RepID=UPI000CE41176|nr:low molecular weight phosphatase family protein [Cryobacterium sp. M91]